MKHAKVALTLTATTLLFGAMSAWAASETIGLSQESLDHPWLATQRKQIQTGCDTAGIRLLATDGQGNVATQIAKRSHDA